MRIAIVGAGALGLYYGGLLQRAGEDVHFLLRRDYDAITRNGLQVFSADGDFHLDTVQGYRDCGDIGPVDLVVIGLKTFNNDRLLELVRPLAGDQTLLLTLQNGLGNEELLRADFPPEQVMGGVAFLCANRGEPGEVHHLGQGAVRIGLAEGGRSEAAERVARVLACANISCELVDDLLKARWEKLVWNIPFNGLCALTGKNVTELLAHPPSRQLAVEIMQEVVESANAQPLSAPIDGPAFIDKMIAATETMAGYRPSMMIDRLEGRPLELDAIYRLPLERAEEAGVATPHIRMLYGLLDLGEG